MIQETPTPISINLTTNGRPLKVHAVSTGLVKVKTKFRSSPYKGLPTMLSWLLDRKFTEWMPIWVWVIEHPEGVILIDTGENAPINDLNYFDGMGWFAK